MSLTDINFSEGEIQDFLLELPSEVNSDPLEDIVVESGGSQLLLLEIPEATGGNIFIMSE